MNRPLKVIQIVDSLAVGGAEVMAVNLSNALAREGHYSHLCVTRNEGLLKERISSPVGYLFLDKKKTIDIKSIVRLKKYISREEISIVHAHSSSFFIAVLIKILIPSIQIFWHDHYGKSDEIEKRKSVILKYSSLFFNSIISVNQVLYFWAKENLFCKNVNYLANFSELNESEPITKLKGIEGKKIICLAAFRPQKDHLNLLKAFKILQEKYSDWTLHLVGGNNEDSYFNDIKGFISENNFKKSIFIYDACLDIKNILRQASIGVLSSSSEGLPLSLLEYGLAGLPVISTNVGDCKFVISSYGLTVDKENNKGLAAAIETYILNKNKREEDGRMFSNHVKLEYSLTGYLNKLTKIYYPC